MQNVDIIANYLRSAQRRLRDDLIVSTISVVGLSIAVGCCIILYLFVQREWTFDDFHDKQDQIFRVVTVETTENGTQSRRATSPAKLGPALQSEFSAIQNSVRLTPFTADVTWGEASSEREILFADPSLLEVFSFDVVQSGSPALQPGNAVVTEEVAKTHVGAGSPVGEDITVEIRETPRTYTIAAVVATPPVTSSIPFDVLLPYGDAKYTFPPGPLRSFAMSSWKIENTRTYVQSASPNVAPVQSSLASFVDTKYEEAAKKTRLELQPLTKVHLSPDVDDALHAASAPMYTYILSALALLILLVACANYVILSLGRAERRTTEVGVRKALGARPEDIGVQFWGEALISTLLAMILGVGLAMLMLPSFNAFFDVDLQIRLSDSSFLLALAGTTLLVSLFAGGYPALSFGQQSFRSILTGRGSTGQRKGVIRGLVVGQFTVAVVLISTVFAMSSQIDHLLQKDLGFNDDSTMMVDVGDASEDEISAFQTEVQSLAGVENSAGALSAYGKALSTEFVVSPTATADGYLNVVDSTFAETIGLDLVAGRNFSAERSDDNSVLVNQAFVDVMEWDTPIGQTVDIVEGNVFAEAVTGREVVGVVQNYHYESLHHSIAPLVLMPSGTISGSTGDIVIRLSGNEQHAVLQDIETIWSQTVSASTLRYEFVDRLIADQYASEQRWQSVITYGAIAAILIACAGLFGLALLSARRRRKEIGIRKVLGATRGSIMRLMLRDFGALVLIATVLAVPLGYIGIKTWIQNFSYPAAITPLPFVYAILTAAGVALLTVGYVSLRSASTQPVHSIRAE